MQECSFRTGNNCTKDGAKIRPKLERVAQSRSNRLASVQRARNAGVGIKWVRMPVYWLGHIQPLFSCYFILTGCSFAVEPIRQSIRSVLQTDLVSLGSNESESSVVPQQRK